MSVSVLSILLPPAKLFQDIDYDGVDWNENLDADHDRDTEEKWFNDEDEE